MTSQNITLSEGVSATFANGNLSITGPKGTVVHTFDHPKIVITIKGSIIEFTTKVFTKREKKLIQTMLAQIRNATKGVTEGHTYKLKVCSGHFPMNVSVKGKTFEVKNFIGEVVPRTHIFAANVEVKLEGDVVSVSGIEKNIVSQTAASIEQLTRRNGFDRRVFQDGIYITEKDGKSLMVSK